MVTNPVSFPVTAFSYLSLTNDPTKPKLPSFRDFLKGTDEKLGNGDGILTLKEYGGPVDRFKKFYLDEASLLSPTPLLTTAPFSYGRITDEKVRNELAKLDANQDGTVTFEESGKSESEFMEIKKSVLKRVFEDRYRMQFKYAHFDKITKDFVDTISAFSVISGQLVIDVDRNGRHSRYVIDKQNRYKILFLDGPDAKVPLNEGDFSLFDKDIEEIFNSAMIVAQKYEKPVVVMDALRKEYNSFRWLGHPPAIK